MEGLELENLRKFRIQQILRIIQTFPMWISRSSDQYYWWQSEKKNVNFIYLYFYNVDPEKINLQKTAEKRFKTKLQLG